MTLIMVWSTSSSAPAKDELSFEKDVQPLLEAKCGKCHNAQARKGGLDLSTMAGLKRGGESGESVVNDSPAESLLWIMVDGGDMPPEDEPQLTGDEKNLIRSWLAAGAPSQHARSELVTQHDILPYLYARCVACHGARRREAKLDLRTVESILAGGKSGPAVVPGKPEESLLLERVLSKDMPPPRELIRAGVRPLESSEIELITEWIAQGAKEYEIAPDVQGDEPDPLVSDEDRTFWAFQSPRKPDVPTHEGESSARCPIDAFLLRQLSKHGLAFSEEASKRTLIRRVAFDLTGLPPQWNDVECFLADESGDWYETLVDFYLESPHYGEQWGRHWLDLCGYADSEGKRSADPIRPHAWRYRDYVIRSLNDDKPYNRFLLEQIAGDELYDFENADSVTSDMMDALIATGFLRMAPDGTGSDIVDTVEERFEVLADEIEVLGSAVLGLTLKCAQCHTHKYDPIPQRDYYRLVAVFRGAYDVYDWMKPTSVSGQSEQKNAARRYLNRVTSDVRHEWEAAKRPIEQQIADVKKELRDQETKLRSRLVDARLETLPEEIRDDLRSMLQTPAAKRTAVQEYLAGKFEQKLTVTADDLKRDEPEFAKQKTQAQKQIKSLRSKLPPEPLIRALWDRGEPSPTWIFRRGEFTNPGDYVGPGVLSVLSDGQSPFVASPTPSDSTGRRLAFAQWLVDPRHPLTARVIVNRVWYHHFGRGIVETLANFGKTGTTPTHPELLDWLAVSFVENGWCMKWLHRQIMHSAAYRQSSRLHEEVTESDTDNRWLSRMPLRRRDAESVRDSLLAVSGQLDRKRFGPPDPVNVRADGLVTSNRSDAGWRRTIYVQQRRKELPTILEAFDLPQMIPNCTERPNSTVASQALHLLNNGMIRQLSLAFAQRIESENLDDREQQIERVYEIALTRHPSPEEKQHAIATLEQLEAHWQSVQAKQSDESKTVVASPRTKALANVCHVIMNSAEFLFVD